MSAIHDWVASLLRRQPVVGGGAPQFFLYTTPPPTPLARTEGTTIEEARLVPAILLYLGWGVSPSQRAVVPAGGLSATEFLSDEALAAAAEAAPGPLAPAVGTSVDLRALGEGLLQGPPSAGAPPTARAGGKRGAAEELTEDMMAAMAARLLGGGGGGGSALGGAASAAGGGARATQAGSGSRGGDGSGVPGGVAAGASGGSRAVPSWLQTGGSSKR